MLAEAFPELSFLVLDSEAFDPLVLAHNGCVGLTEKSQKAGLLRGVSAPELIANALSPRLDCFLKSGIAIADSVVGGFSWPCGKETLDSLLKLRRTPLVPGATRRIDPEIMRWINENFACLDYEPNAAWDFLLRYLENAGDDVGVVAPWMLGWACGVETHDVIREAVKAVLKNPDGAAHLPLGAFLWLLDFTNPAHDEYKIKRRGVSYRFLELLRETLGVWAGPDSDEKYKAVAIAGGWSCGDDEEEGGDEDDGGNEGEWAPV